MSPVVGDRDGEQFASPKEQHERIQQACARDGLRLIDVWEEMSVSGGTPLEKREKMRRAVEWVESGRADVIVVAYFDRLVRKLSIQEDIVDRVEAAGGSVGSRLRHHLQRHRDKLGLSASQLGLVNEYHRRVTAERTVDAKRQTRHRPRRADVPEHPARLPASQGR